jgi:hypothetical protein
MASRVWVGLALLVLAPQAMAWGDYASQYFCDRVVRDVWGQQVYDECLTTFYIEDQMRYCRMMGDKRAECMNISDVLHPAVLPNALGEDDLQQQGDCPITTYTDKEHLCANETEALDKAGFFLDEAMLADTLCGRVHLFCIAGNYLAQTHNPLNWVLHEDEKCRQVFNRKVDFDLRYNQTKWGVTQVCVFDYGRPSVGGEIRARYSQSITITEAMVDSVVGNLTEEASILMAAPIKGTTLTTTSSTTSTTQETTSTTSTTTLPAVATTTTTSTSTTTAPPVTSTTLPVKEGGVSVIWYLAGLLVIAGGAAGAILLLKQGGPEKPQKKKGLRGLGGAAPSLEKGYSKLGDADRIPKMREQFKGVMEENGGEPIPNVDREREFLSDKGGYHLDTAEAGVDEIEERREEPHKKKVKSLIQRDRDGTSLGER